ncbi:MAG: 2-polyprenyl-3-methyl-6-methoxy-1,4-benzoquinone monooxygenase [Porticoccaceae bacterium]|nr:2-polyprenyl-3-methyl-6-methoxy-1,4-benzoquinone monooxygenase [Pseudomonadales bacterium]MCP5172824.1 2-polyprenyl-3-methyl-6-methoxy-1,4-benzoquinone monooxygenase [Pseudomonadales bacterium]MCP5302298.1 2-polyprenyl-3-methyl-6-methoxy-1,4-benzoquinone monooxygenase [Pseudomonadales bacterium]
MSAKHLSPLDQFLAQVDRALRTVATKAPAPERKSPAEHIDTPALSAEEKRHAAGLMRVNHSGEVCAQALYQGQALTAKLTHVRQEMEQAADEEIDHLAWCEERVKELGEQTSVLNPLWYALSFGIGATTGLISDRLSLGFVSATEDQVCQHLESHLAKLPPEDKKSRAIVEQMLEDEAKHSCAALEAGGLEFPPPAKAFMSLISNAMTRTSYKI